MRPNRAFAVYQTFNVFPKFKANGLHNFELITMNTPTIWIIYWLSLLCVLLWFQSEERFQKKTQYLPV